MTDCSKCYYHGKHYSGGRIVKGMDCSMERFNPDPEHCPYFVEWRVVRPHFPSGWYVYV